MPVLPKLETSQSVFSDGSLGYQQIQSDPEAFGGGVAKGLESVSQGLQQAGAQTGDAALRQLDLQRETNANNQYANSFSPALRDIYTKYYSLQGKDAVDQMPAFTQQIMDLQNQQRDALKDPVAQHMFDQVSTRRTQMELDGMARYADQQNKVYQTQASDGMVRSFQQTAADRSNDPIVFNGMVQSVEQERMAHAATVGQPVEYAKAQVQKDTSAMWVDRLKGIAATNPQQALDLLNHGEDWTDTTGNARHTDVSASLLPADQVAMRSLLNTHLADSVGVQFGNQATNPAVPTSGGLIGVIQHLESKGDPNAVGPYIPGQGTAKGAMQVMDATNKDPGFGVAPAKDNSPEERARVGRDYAVAMQNRYGDPAKALAAYNAGPGVVDAAVKAAGANWLSQMPKETQAYVRSGVNMLNASSAAPGGAVTGTLPVSNVAAVPNAAQISAPPVGLSQDPVDMRANQDAAAEQARKAAADHVMQTTGDPVAAKRAGDIAHSTVIGNTSTAIAAAEARQRSAANALTSLLVGDTTKGQVPITTMDQLVKNPEAYANYNALSTQGQAAVRERLSKPNQITQEGFNTYYKLRGEALSDPESFLHEDLSQYFGKMPEAQLNHLVEVQSSITKKDAAQASKDISWNRTKSDVDDMLKPLGLGSAASRTDTDKQATNAQFYGRLQDQLEQYHQQNGKYPNTQDTRKIAASLLVQGSQAGASWFGFGSKTMPAFASTDLSKFSVPVPDAQKPQFSAMFQRVMGHAPTDDELTQWYTKYKLGLKDKKNG